MKRKLICMGKKTYAVTLPMSWIRRYQLEKGQELTIAERESSILISNKSITAKKAISIKIDSQQHLKNYLFQLYRQGYEEITLHHKNLNTAIAALLPYLHGMEIMEESPTACKLKSFALEDADFENLLRRLLFIIANLNKKPKNELRMAHESALKLINYLHRLLHKREHGSYDKTLLLMSLLHELEYALQAKDSSQIYDSFYNFSQENNLETNRVAQIAFALHLEKTVGNHDHAGD